MAGTASALALSKSKPRVYVQLLPAHPHFRRPVSHLPTPSRQAGTKRRWTAWRALPVSARVPIWSAGNSRMLALIAEAVSRAAKLEPCRHRSDAVATAATLGASGAMFGVPRGTRVGTRAITWWQNNVESRLVVSPSCTTPLGRKVAQSMQSRSAQSRRHTPRRPPGLASVRGPCQFPSPWLVVGCMARARMPLGLDVPKSSPHCVDAPRSPAVASQASPVSGGSPELSDGARLLAQEPGPFSLFVGDLAFEASGEALEALFGARYSSLVEAYVISDRTTSRSKGYGFVRLADVQQAQQAIAEMNGQLFMGRCIRVSAAGPKPPAGARSPAAQSPRPAGAAAMPDLGWQPRPAVVPMPLAGQRGGYPGARIMQPGMTQAPPPHTPFHHPPHMPGVPGIMAVGCNSIAGTLTLLAASTRLSWVCARAELAGEVRRASTLVQPGTAANAEGLSS